MRLADFLGKDAVVPDLRARDKDGVLAELAQALVASHQIPEVSGTVQVLLERERLGSTGIGEGIAIPHGKLSTLTQVVGAFGRSRNGVEFESMDGAPVHLFFLLLAPENSASAHLKALARISRLLKNRAFREELLKAETPDDLYETIVREDEKV